MPQPAEREHRYVAGLDGLRAVAVLCVIAYHVNAPWARGGMLGVGVFFTLSGYLITDLLLEHYRRRGSLGLGDFWLRRARRLLPALFLMLVVVSVLVALFDTSQLAEVRRQVISGAFYFANWSTIAVHGSYFARFSPTLPLDHLWSLSIEEQFYLVWPWVLLLAIRFLRGRSGLLVLTLGGAAGSALAMAQLYHPGTFDPTRLYEGTDTRAFELLLGAALAVVRPSSLPRGAARRVAAHRRVLLDVAGLAGLAGIVVLVWRTTPFTAFLYPYGFLLLSLATLAAIAAVLDPASALGALLGSGPLRWIGVRSYGIYLWQWPIVVLWGQPATGVHWGRAALQVGATLAVASLSWRYVEEPIRRGALGRLWLRTRVGMARLSARRAAYALTATALAAGAATGASLAGVLPQVSAGHGAAQISAMPARLHNTPAAPDPQPRPPAKALLVQTSRPAKPTRTSCRSVVYIGDSTSEGQVERSYLPKWRQRLHARLVRVGVVKTHMEISGARSIVETYGGAPNAATVAEKHISRGYRGCWIIAMGTNDAADVAVGSNVGLPTRIARMMKIIGRRPVLWIDAITLLSSGPYAESEMQKWNAALLAACRRHPTMRIYDWAAHAKRKWFISDGTHYYSAGYAARNRFFARGLVKAFPEGGPPSASCLVR